MSLGDLARRTARGLHAARTTGELLDAVRSALASLGHHGGHAVVFHEEGDEKVRLCNSSEHRHQPGALLSPADDLSVGALRHGAPWYANGSLGRLSGEDGSLPVGALLPLRSGDDECYGALVTTERVLDEQRETLELLAEHLGLALVRVQLHEEVSRRHQDDLAKLGLLTRAGEVLRSIDLETVLSALMELALATVEAEVGCILLSEEAEGSGDDEPRIRIEWGLDAAVVRNLRVADGRTLARAVTDDGRGRLSARVASDPELRASGPAESVESVVAVPLATRDRTLGCLIAARGEGGGFAERDLELLSVTVGLCSNAIQSALLHRVELEREHLRAELRLAGDVQKSLLPRKVPELDGLSCAARVWPCDESGGDYYDFMRLDADRLAFCVGDATGHGIGAAFITTTARASLRARLSGQTFDAGDLLDEVNRLLVEDMQDGRFITLFLGVWNRRDRTIGYASAGHDPGLLYRRRLDAFEQLESTGPPLGVLPELRFASARTAPLEPGDLLVVNTDGAPEAFDPEGAQFGRKRMLECIRSHRDEEPAAVVEGLYRAVTTHRGTAPPSDDVTILCLRAR